MEQTEYPLVVEVFHTEMKNCVIEISALCGSLNFIISKGSSRGKNSMCFLHSNFLLYNWLHSTTFTDTYHVPDMDQGF